jgi:hypothetical protein
MKRGTTPASTENMKKIWLLGLALVMVGFGASTAFALDPMGPPAAELKRGQLGLGLDYSHSEMDLEMGDGKLTEHRDGVFDVSAELASLTIKDFTADRVYARVGYGVIENWEAFLRIGGTMGEFGDSLWDDGEEFDGDIDFAVGGGVKATFYEGFNLTIGGLLQVSWAEFDGKLDASHWPAPDFVGIDLAQMQIAAGATYMWTDRVSVYGGPFAHFIQGDFDDVFSTEDGGDLVTTELSWDIDEGPTYGAYVGTRVKLVEECSFNIELQLTGDAYAVGASVMWRY